MVMIYADAAAVPGGSRGSGKHAEGHAVSGAGPRHLPRTLVFPTFAAVAAILATTTYVFPRGNAGNAAIDLTCPAVLQEQRHALPMDLVAVVEGVGGDVAALLGGRL
jgi:hypothetical protein